MPALSHHVDPFLGNDALDLPEPDGIAATWFLPKAQNGNTHPGACSPFGMVSVAPYSGAYITGYGLYRLNTHGQAPRLHEDYVASGFTHFQQSGTGNIVKFYNYLRVTPLPEGVPLSSLGRNWPLADERAEPGRYRCRLPDLDVAADLTVTPRAARHRYTYPAPGGRAVIDLSVGGILSDPRMTSHPEALEVRLDGPTHATGWVLVEGVTLYFHIALLSAGSGTLWQADREIDDTVIHRAVLDPTEPQPLGISWQTTDNEIELAIGFSLGSVEQATANAGPATTADHATVVSRTGDRWRTMLDAISVEGGTDDERTIFASALYHSLIKPIDVSGEDPTWLHGGDCFLDVATLWDQYKTQLPLIQTIYPEIGNRIATAFMNTADHYGDMPCGLLMAVDHTRFADQASCLAHQVWYGAWCRRLPGFDAERALRLMVASFHRGQGLKLLKGGRFASQTHVLDLSQAAWCTARLAEGLGHEELVERFDHIADYSWRHAFDDQGLLKPGTYYEGSRATYSFRPFHAMDDRITTCSGGTTRFVQQLDYFFGFTRQPVEQPGWQPSDTFMDEGINLGSFEGLNNEPDMETPYSYCFAGRHDRTAEVIRAIRQFMFTTGRGGLPGNDDSGGLSSWYVWSAIGLFPITGTALMCIGSPAFDRVTMPWCGDELVIEAPGAAELPYIVGARLNGEPLDRPLLRLDELTGGGRLELDLAAKPNDWGLHSQVQLRPIARRY